MDLLVDTEWLAHELANGAPDLVVLDATKVMPDSGRDPKAEFEAAHIPGARFLNLEDFVDPDDTTDNSLPTAERVEQWLGRLGIGNETRIVLYDDSPLKTSARAWWILKTFGALKVAILDGGIGKWKAEGRPTESGAASDPAPAAFTAYRDTKKIRDKEDMLDNLDSKAEEVLDARPAERFEGQTPEPRPGMEAGHIPGSKNLPIGKLFNEDGTYKDDEELEDIYESTGIDLDQPLVTSCGSGVTAAVLAFGAHLFGKRDVALYDGSWAEWGKDPATPKETGPAQ